MGRKLRTEQPGIFPGNYPERYAERDGVVSRELSRRAGLPAPEDRNPQFENLGNQELPVHLKKTADSKYDSR